MNGPWLGRRLSAFAVRRCLDAGDSLFCIGDKARHYFLVEAGCLGLERRQRRGAGAFRLAAAGTLLIYDCGGFHAAACTALVQSRLLSLERRQVEQLARCDPGLAGLVRSAHARELCMILESLGAGGVRPPETDCFRAWNPTAGADVELRGRWLPHPHLSPGSRPA